MIKKNLAEANKKTEVILEKIIESTKEWEAQGKDAWTNLRNLKGGNLADGDEIIIARNMHKEIKTLKAQLKSIGKSLADFCQAAGLGNEGDYSKEIYRLTLAPNSDPKKVRLRKSAAKYRQLIEQLSRETKESTSAIANRVLIGTNLHPVDAVNRDEVERVQMILQVIVEVIDKEFGLYAAYMETARLKVEHAKEGGELRWPHDSRESRLLDFGGTLSLMRCFGETLTLTPELAAIRKEIITREIEHTANERNAYWSYKFGYFNGYVPPIYSQSGCLQDEEFFYIPHVHLGYLGYLDSFLGSGQLDDSELGIEIQRDLSEFCEKPEDILDPESRRPKGQFSSLNEYHAPYHAWLVIYPSPDNLRLMLMLYMALEECGSFLLPLDAVHLNAMRKQICIVENKVTNVFKQIEKMLGIEDQTNNAILEGFRRTAPWLKENPFFKLKLEYEVKMKAKLKNYSDYYSKMLNESLSRKGQ